MTNGIAASHPNPVGQAQSGLAAVAPKPVNFNRCIEEGNHTLELAGQLEHNIIQAINLFEGNPINERETSNEKQAAPCASRPMNQILDNTEQTRHVIQRCLGLLQNLQDGCF